MTNTEEAGKAWWDAEGRRMERLPHHDAMDHMASVTRIAWLNGAFEAADEIERLRAERDEARREVCNMNETGLRMNESDKKREAKRRGWDCFKEHADD